MDDDDDDEGVGMGLFPIEVTTEEGTSPVELFALKARRSAELVVVGS